MADTGWASADEEMTFLTRGIVDLIQASELRTKLERSRGTGVPLTVKVGFDPTAPDIHLGHTVVLEKMRQFQDLGHRVIFVIGDLTALIGDPTGRSKIRPALSPEEVAANAETYKRQCFKVLDPAKTEIRFNSEWLGALTSKDWIRLTSKYNVARMLERKDFKTRFQAGRSISIHEFLYPMAQAFDSVFLKADVELGGTDQLFNLNVGREIMPGYGIESQIIMTTPLLEGLDGVEKMSKSMGNYVGIDEPPGKIFGKLMSITDDLMWRYYELCTSVSPEKIEEMKALVNAHRLHPKKAKENLAMRIVAQFHGHEAARQACDEFERIFQKNGLPDQMPEHRIPAKDGRVFLPALLVSLGLASSNSDAARLIRQGGVRMDNEKIAPDTREVAAPLGQARVLKVGKHRFARLIFF